MSKIESHVRTRVVAYSITNDVEKQVRAVLSYILLSHNCAILLAPIYTSVKELIINAIKANYKNIYFEGYASRNRLHETLTYETSLRLFQLEMSSENAQHLERIAKKEDIKAEIELFENGNILHVIVTNPGRMTQTELKNINHKLIDAENCRDIAEYFLRNMDDPTREGAGLGLILIKMMLKSLHAPADSLTITCEENRTTAYLKVPLVTDVEICA